MSVGSIAATLIETRAVSSDTTLAVASTLTSPRLCADSVKSLALNAMFVCSATVFVS